MQEKYEIIRDKLGTLGFAEYGHEFFNSLAFKMEGSVIYDINRTSLDMFKTLLVFDEMYKNKKYSLSYLGNLNESANLVRRNDTVNLFAKNVENEYKQYSNIANKLNIDCSDIDLNIDLICKKTIDKLSFLKKGQNFIEEYFQIEKFLSFESDIEEQDIFISELLDLKDRYSDIFKILPLYSDYLDELSSEFNSYKYDFKQLIKELSDRIIAVSPETLLSNASMFLRDISNVERTELSDFLILKENESNIDISLKLTSSQKIESLFVFKDGSILYKKSGNFYETKEYNDIEPLMIDIEESIIMYQLRKKPKIAKVFLDKYKQDLENVYNLENVIMPIDTYLKNEQILKNMNFDFNMFNNSSFEVIHDKMHEMVDEHKLLQYSNSILSNKYKFLLDEEVLKSFKVLLDNGISKKSLQDIVGKKIASIKDSEQFNKYLSKVIDHFSGFTIEILSEKLKSFNIKEDYNQNGLVIFEVKNFEESKAFGSPSWCISRYKNYFTDYTSNDSRQFFIYDFNKSEKDNKSMIGFTLYKNGRLRTQHLKNDDYYCENEEFNNLIDSFIYNKKEEFELSKDLLDRLELKYKKYNKNSQLKIGNL